MMATLMILIMGACLRGRHYQRSHLVGIASNALVFNCIRGKTRKKGVRPPFQFPVPRFWIEGVDVLGAIPEFYSNLSAKRAEQGLPRLEEAPFLIPC